MYKKTKKSWQQQEVMNYKNAIDYGFNALNSNDVISTRLIKKLHKILMENAQSTTANGGEFRKIQNFIGPNNKIENIDELSKSQAILIFIQALQKKP